MSIPFDTLVGTRVAKFGRKFGERKGNRTFGTIRERQGDFSRVLWDGKPEHAVELFANIDIELIDLVQPYRNALTIQTACNISGLAHSLSRDMEVIWEELRQQHRCDTDNLNHHPAIRLYAEQLSFLSRSDYFDAHKVCEDMVRSQPEAGVCAPAASG